MPIKLDHQSLRIEKILQKGIEIIGTFHLHIAKREKRHNEGQKVSVDNEGVLIIRDALAKELFTSKLSGYFRHNVSNPTAITWRINLYDKISKKDRAIIEKALIDRCKVFLNEQTNFDGGNDKNNIRGILFSSILRSYENCLSEQIKNEADLKYFLYCQLRESLIDSENKENLILVEYKIRQGNDEEAWFSRSNYQKKKHYFQVGYELEDHNYFVKLKPTAISQIGKDSLNHFNKQKERTFKIDLVIINQKTGQLIYLIELKFSSSLDLNALNQDLIKFEIHNSITHQNTNGIALGYNRTKKKMIVRSNDSHLQNELTKILDHKSASHPIKSTGGKKETVSDLSSSRLIKIAEKSLFNKEVFGGYDNFLESSWQAEFNYNFTRSIPVKYNLRNEVHLEDTKGRVDLVIINELRNAKYIVEFKVHGENKLYEIKNKIFNNRERIDLFIERMITLLNNSDQLSKNIIRKENFPDGYILSSSFISKIVETYSQFRRIQKFILTNPGVKGFIFFTHWSTDMSDYYLNKYSISKGDFNDYLTLREEVMRRIIRIDKFTNDITLKYFNILV